MHIKKFNFNKNNLPDMKEYKYGNDWPVVYMINNKD